MTRQILILTAVLSILSAYFTYVQCKFVIEIIAADNATVIVNDNAHNARVLHGDDYINCSLKYWATLTSEIDGVRSTYDGVYPPRFHTDPYSLTISYVPKPSTQLNGPPQHADSWHKSEKRWLKHNNVIHNYQFGAMDKISPINVAMTRNSLQFNTIFANVSIKQRHEKASPVEWHIQRGNASRPLLVVIAGFAILINTTQYIYVMEPTQTMMYNPRTDRVSTRYAQTTYDIHIGSYTTIFRDGQPYMVQHCNNDMILPVTLTLESADHNVSIAADAYIWHWRRINGEICNFTVNHFSAAGGNSTAQFKYDKRRNSIMLIAENMTNITVYTQEFRVDGLGNAKIFMNGTIKTWASADGRTVIKMDTNRTNALNITGWWDLKLNDTVLTSRIGAMVWSDLSPSHPEVRTYTDDGIAARSGGSNYDRLLEIRELFYFGTDDDKFIWKIAESMFYTQRHC